MARSAWWMAGLGSAVAASAIHFDPNPVTNVTGSLLPRPLSTVSDRCNQRQTVLAMVEMALPLPNPRAQGSMWTLLAFFYRDVDQNLCILVQSSWLLALLMVTSLH